MATAKKAKISAKSVAKSGAKAGAKVGPKAGAKAGVKNVKGKVASVAKVVPKSTPKVTPKANLKATPKSTPKVAAKVATKAIPKAAAAKTVAPKAVVVKEEIKVALKVPVKTAVPVVARPTSKLPQGSKLTEAELLKQAKSEYMSKDQLAFFRLRLIQLQTELRENAGATTEHLRELAVAPDPADRATLEEEHALELRARDRERKLQKKVEGALLRIESGEYGYCDETGEPIGIPRLLARPTATLTIEAQERRELKQKMYGE